MVRGAALAAAEPARKKVLFRVNEDVSYMWTVMRQDAEAMRRIGEYAEAGELTPPNVVAMRLDDAADAHRAASRGMGSTISSAGRGARSARSFVRARSALSLIHI